MRADWASPTIARPIRAHSARATTRRIAEYRDFGAQGRNRTLAYPTESAAIFELRRPSVPASGPKCFLDVTGRVRPCAANPGRLSLKTTAYEGKGTRRIMSGARFRERAKVIAAIAAAIGSHALAARPANVLRAFGMVAFDRILCSRRVKTDLVVRGLQFADTALQHRGRDRRFRSQWRRRAAGVSHPPWIAQLRNLAMCNLRRS